MDEHKDCGGKEQMELLVHSQLEPVKERLTRVEVRTEHLESGMKDMQSDLKEIKTLLVTHIEDEENTIVGIKTMIVQNQEKILALRWWLASIGAVILGVVAVLDKLHLL